MRWAPWLLTTMILTATPLPIGAQSAPEGDFNLPPELTILGPTDPSVRKATAIVNGEIITDTDIEHRLNLVLTANRGQVDAAERERLRMQVLRNLIDEKLQIQEARSNEITIPEAEVEQTFARVAQNFKREPKDFAEFLKASGSSDTALKQQIRGELARSEEHTSELQSLMRTSYAVFCLPKKKKQQ